ncbi:DUF3380 domain-containing protein [Georhizobium profundi]|uniref:DUF3380 domain-containing protein n=1 Tax=Georhizobium profundi TaxID=2341112 RepID=A0A3Q8XTG4_9HYPH|nr:N-acetylmuramidase domain-containing protein [Georhizobium profundi]AZN73252.1 DUF3380 domain-containing protein [Georhizobium profundi]
MLTQSEKDVVKREAERLRVETAALMAIIEIESGGRTHAIVSGRAEPLIRFEGHYFDRLVSPGNRAKARAEGLASPRAGAVANPASQTARWALLNRAMKIDRDAAYASTSWGLGQVMGEHWCWLGYASVDAMVAEARAGFAGQLRLMLRYIEKAGLTDAVRRRDWSAFARAYNGPAYARHGYHTRLAAAYARLAGSPGEGSPSPRLLRLGMSGADVAALQRHLLAISPDQHDAIAVDGVFGPQTLAALKAFQLGAGLTPDGIAGPLTWAALERVAQVPPKHDAVQPWSWLISLLNRLNPWI